MSWYWTIVNWTDDVTPVDYATESMQNIITQYQNSSRIKSFVEELANEVQKVDDVAYDVLAKMSVYTAEGIQLDLLGKIVMQGRQGMTDDEYRQYLLARILVNKSDGLWNQLFEILDRINQPDYWYVDLVISSGIVVVLDAPYPEAVADLIRDWKPCGVNFDVRVSSYDTDNTFRFSGTLTTESDLSDGYSNPLGTTGGYWIGDL